MRRFLLLAMAAIAVPWHGFCAGTPATLPATLPLEVRRGPIPWTPVAEFLPARAGQGNAAEFYAQAARTIRQLPGFPSLAGRESLAADPAVRQAMSQAFEGALQARADFMALYSYRSWEDNAVPDLAAALVLAQALRRSTEAFVEAGQTDQALAAAQALVSMGEHFRSGAPTLAQATAAEMMIQQGLRASRAVYARTGRADLARLAAERAFMREQADAAATARSAAMAVGFQTPSIALRALRDDDPLVRSDALLLIEKAFDPAGSQAMLSDPDTQPLAIMLRNDAVAVRQAVAGTLQDPSERVRTLAERVYGGLGEAR